MKSQQNIIELVTRPHHDNPFYFCSRDVANRENEYYESDSLDSEKFFSQASQQRAGKPMAALQAQGKDSAVTAMPSLASSGGSVTGKQV